MQRLPPSVMRLLVPPVFPIGDPKKSPSQKVWENQPVKTISTFTMRKIFIVVIIVFMFSFGLALAVDLLCVLNGNVEPAGGPLYKWNNSPIFHYNVSRAANMMIGMLAVMGLFGAWGYSTIIRSPKKVSG